MTQTTLPTDSRAVEAAGFGPLAGDHSDDDGQALDDYFEAGPQAPIVYSDGDGYADNRPAHTRMIVRSYVLTSANGVNPPDPVMILPADANRLELFIESSSETLTIASDKSDCYYPGAIMRGGRQVYSQCHTGAVWVYTTETVTPVTVTVRVVTR